MFNGLIRGILKGEFLGSGFSLHNLVQRRTDGALARFYTAEEWRELLTKDFKVERISVMGQKSEMIPLPPSAFKRLLTRWIPDGVGRLFLNRLRQGSFLIATISKRA